MSNPIHIRKKIEVQGRWFCCDCKSWLDELREEQECMGEFWGMPAYETFYYCPECGSDCIVDGDRVTPEDLEEN